MPEGNEFGRFIRACRENLGFSLRKVAELSQENDAFEPITPGYLAMLEHGRHVPSFAKVLMLSKVLHVPLRHFEDHYWIGAETVGEPCAPPAGAAADTLAAAWKDLEGGHVDDALHRFKLTAKAAGPDESGDFHRFEARLGADICRFRKGHCYAAREDLEEIFAKLDVDPVLRARAASVLAEIHQALGNHELAALHAKGALRSRESGANRPRLYLLLGEAELGRGARDRAAAAFKRVLRNPDSIPRYRLRARRKLASILSSRGDISQAEEHLRACLSPGGAFEEALESAKAGVQLARILLNRGSRREAGCLARESLSTGRHAHDSRLMLGALSVLEGIAKLSNDPVREREYGRSVRLLEKRAGALRRSAPAIKGRSRDTGPCPDSR